MPVPDALSSRTPLARSSVAKLLGMSLLILGVKFWLLQVGSAPLPVFDQWEAEGQRLLQPWLHDQFSLHHLFAPWAQHRILWTRLIVLGLLRINGQWDTQLEAMVSELIHVGTALLLGVILIRRLGRRWEDAILLCLLVLFALPIALANTLSGGFASQQYLLLFFAVVAIRGLSLSRPGSAGWWVGVAGAVAAWFSVATGALPTLTVAALMAFRLARREGLARENWLTFGMALVLTAIGSRLTLGLGHLDELEAHSVGDFLTRLCGLLGWPNPTAWAAPVAWAPFAWFLWRTLRQRHRPLGPVEIFLLPFGLFVFLNTVGLAYARNRYGDLHVSRYMDFLSFGALVNFLCLLVLLRDTGGTGRGARAMAPCGLLVVVWVACAGFGLIELTTRNLAVALPFVKSCSQREIEDVASFVARPTPGALARRTRLDDMCDNPALAINLLQDAEILQILPAQVRLPVVLDSAETSPLVQRVNPDPGSARLASWVLERSSGRQPVYFRSRVVHGSGLPYLRFPMVSDLGGEAFIALVDERSGATTWLQAGTGRDGTQSILVKTPSNPFHVEAVVAAGANRRLAFMDPREVGRLSAWVDPLLDSATLLLCAGAVIWLGAVFWYKIGLHALGDIRWRLPKLVRRRQTSGPGEFVCVP